MIRRTYIGIPRAKDKWLTRKPPSGGIGKNHTTSDAFDNVSFAVESAILSTGILIDIIFHTGAMLERTRSNVGRGKVLFLSADVYEFCSATDSRQVMEAGPNSLYFCAYGIRIVERPETVSHQTYTGTMEPVNALVKSIVTEALGLK